MINDRNAWIGFAVLLLLVAVLGVKSRKTAAHVLKSDVQHATTAVIAGNDPHDLAVIARRDSILEEARTLRRNPFRRNRVVEPVKPVVQREEAPAQDMNEGPRLLTLLYDDVGPCVQIRVEGERSGWLHVGETFQGWKVDEIAEGAVGISRRGRELVLK
jgi:hypothetical protein